MRYSQHCSNAYNIYEINQIYPLHLQWNESTDKLNQSLKHWQIIAVSNTWKISFRILFYMSDFHVHWVHYCQLQLYAIPVWQQTKMNEHDMTKYWLNLKNIIWTKNIKTENVWKRTPAVFECSGSSDSGSDSSSSGSSDSAWRWLRFIQQPEEVGHFSISAGADCSARLLSASFLYPLLGKRNPICITPLSCFEFHLPFSLHIQLSIAKTLSRPKKHEKILNISSKLSDGLGRL